jgi:hypothetical protein
MLWGAGITQGSARNLSWRRPHESVGNRESGERWGIPPYKREPKGLSTLLPIFSPPPLPLPPNTGSQRIGTHKRAE